MRRQNPDADYRLLTNGVDLEYFHPAENTVRHGIVFAGKLNVYANILMARHIAKDLFPLIKNVIPGMKLDIVGARPSQAVLSTANDSVHVHSDVPEIKPYLQQAQLFLHPHDGASGIQNKILEAMACGCPVVTTPTGIQGIGARDGIEVLIGNTNEELVDRAVRILQNPELAQTIATNARKLIEKTHSWSVIFNQLDGIMEEVMFAEKKIEAT